MGHCCLGFKFDTGLGRISVKMEKFCTENNKENLDDLIN